MVKYGTLVELPDARLADIDNRLMPFRFFFSPPPPPPSSTCSSLSQHEKEIKNKLSTDSPCFGPLSVGWSKEIIVKIVHISEDDHEHFGEERVAGRAYLMSSSL